MAKPASTTAPYCCTRLGVTHRLDVARSVPPTSSHEAPITMQISENRPRCHKKPVIWTLLIGGKTANAKTIPFGLKRVAMKILRNLIGRPRNSYKRDERHRD